LKEESVFGVLIWHDMYVKQKAILFTVGYRYLGGKADLRVCNPYVEKDDEYSTTQVALLTGSYNDFECVQSGWAVRTLLLTFLFLCIFVISKT